MSVTLREIADKDMGFLGELERVGYLIPGRGRFLGVGGGLPRIPHCSLTYWVSEYLHTGRVASYP